jgi:hypothetical protein
MHTEISKRQAEPSSCFAYPFTAKIEAVCSSETSMNFKRNARCHIPDNVLFKGTAVRISTPTFR